MGGVKYLLGILILAACVKEGFMQITVQNFTSYAKTCNECNSTNADCAPKSGYVLCSCKSGFVGDGLNCTKLVFCDTFPCCPQGYYWDTSTKKCVDINECTRETTNACLGKAYCVNKNGIYLCNDPKNPACPTNTCNSTSDCYKNVGSDALTSLNCMDPCQQYREIDGSSRLYTISSSGRFSTDRYLFGWYRYKNGLRMKEGCTGILKCGSLEPLSLSSHPTLSEGVKSVILLNNALTGCSNGPSILVKACPGGYHVYKLAGLLKSDVYCTEVAPVTTTPPTTTTTTPTTTSTTTTTTTTTEPTTSTTTTTTQPTTTSTTTEPTTSTTTTTTPPTTTSTTTEPKTSTTTTTTPPTTTSTTTEPTTSTTTTTTEPTTSTTTTTTEPATSTTTTEPTTSTTTTTTEPTTSTTTTEPTTSSTTTTTEPTTSTTTTEPTTSTTTTTTEPTSSTTTTSPTNTLTSTIIPNTGITASFSNSTTTPCPNITSPAPVISTTHIYTEENITVTTVRSKSVLSVRILSQVIDSKEVKSLEINETTTVNIEMKTISPSKVHTKITKSVSPTSVLIIVGGTEPESLNNHTDTTITTTEATVDNKEPFALDSYCSKPAETSTITETSSVAGNTCSKVTSASTTTTITTTEEVIVLGPNGFAKSCTFY